MSFFATLSLFVTLPAYLAIGAGIGFAWARYVSAGKARRVFRPHPIPASPAPSGFQKYWRWLNLLALVCAVIVCAHFFPTASTRSKFDFGVILLGLAAGRWFAQAENDRDKVVFLGASGLLFVVAALQYDLGILNGLTKVGAGSVSVEFTPSKPASPALQDPGGAGGFSGSAFPGANRLDIVVGAFKDLPFSIDRDETYARVFAGENPGRQRDGFPTEDLEPRTGAFRTYAEKMIAPIGAELGIAQSFQRSEESTFSIIPNIAVMLRRSLQLAMSSKNPNIYSVDAAKERHNLLGDSMRELKETLDAEVDSLCGFPQIQGWAAACGLDVGSVSCSGRSDLVAYCKQPRPDAEPLRDGYLFSLVAPSEVDQDFRYFAYLSIVVALSEYAVNNRENAIHVLEREIRRQMSSEPFQASHLRPLRECPNSESAQEVFDCRWYNRARLDWFRRLFAISRLEYVEDYLIAASENPAETPVRIATLKRRIALYDRAFGQTEGGAATRPDLLESANAEQAAEPCAAPTAGDPDAMAALAGIAYNRIAVENDAAWLAATDPEITLAEPFRLADFERYADEVARFDVECLPALNYNVDIGAIRWRNLDTASAFWLLEGQRFGLGAQDAVARLGLTPGRALDALCKAQNANRLAITALRARSVEQARGDDFGASTAREGDQPDPLEARVKVFRAASNEARLLDRVTRIEAAFADYPQGDRDRVCAN